MPLQKGYTTKNGKRVGYWRFGKNGKKYLFKIGNTHSEALARSNAKRQARAIKSSQSR